MAISNEPSRFSWIVQTERISQVETHKYSRRQVIRRGALACVSALVAACAPRVETVVVQGTPQAVEKVVTPTTAPKGTVVVKAITPFVLTRFDAAVKRISEQVPGVKVELTTVNGQGFTNQIEPIITTIAGGEQLDVVHLSIEGVARLGYYILRALEPFLELDPKAKQDLVDGVNPVLTNMLTYHGKLLGIPFSWNNMVIYYNTKMFKEKGIDPPTRDWSWDQFLEACLKIAGVKGTKDDVYAYSFSGGGMFGMCSWFFANGVSPLTDDLRDSNMMDPRIAETLQFLADLILKYKVAPNPTGWNEMGQFHSGHLAMRTCGRWCVADSLAEKLVDYDIQYQPLKSGSVKTVASTDGWGITTMARFPEQAWEVVKQFSGRETSMDMVNAGQNIPALKSVAETKEFLSIGPANSGLWYDSVQYARALPAPINFGVIEPLLNRHFGTIWSAEKTVKEAVEAAHNELQAEMDKIKAEWKAGCPCEY